LFRYKDWMLPLIVGVALLFVLPHPWNGVGFAAALVWELGGTVYGLRWSQRAAPLVGTSALVGVSATVVAACSPRGRVRIGGETWQARSLVAAEPGDRVRVHSIDGLTLHVEPEHAWLASQPAVGASRGAWLWWL
jgi:membrane protein implicated in regulation of membrane protease activity